MIFHEASSPLQPEETVSILTYNLISAGIFLLLIDSSFVENYGKRGDTLSLDQTRNDFLGYRYIDTLKIQKRHVLEA